MLGEVLTKHVVTWSLKTWRLEVKYDILKANNHLIDTMSPKTTDIIASLAVVGILSLRVHVCVCVCVGVRVIVSVSVIVSIHTHVDVQNGTDVYASSHVHVHVSLHLHKR